VKKTERKAIDKVFILLGLASAAMLFVIGGLAWYGQSFATSMVKEELSAQQIFFPEADSKELNGLDEEDRAQMLRFAGQQLTTGDQAKVYANNYIGAHLREIADGKTYAQISTEAMKNPDDKALQGKKTALFQGETLRGLLLGTGYAFWTFGMIAKYIAIASFAGALTMIVLVKLGLAHLAKLK